MIAPLNKIGISQGYSIVHKGVDFGWFSDDKHQDILACDDGVVIYNRCQKTGGYVIHIRHNNGYVSEYGHLLKDSQQVHEGDHVKKGQVIAKMGDSGQANGVHLHFGLYKGTKIDYNKKSNFVNPLKYICIMKNQYVNENTKKKYSCNFSKIVYRVPSEPLLIRDNKNNIVGYLYNGQETEYYGVKLFSKKAIVNNILDYTTYKYYLKD